MSGEAKIADIERRPTSTGAKEIVAELRAPMAAIELVHFHCAEPSEWLLRGEGKFRIDQCLTSRPRSSRGCFRSHWTRHRFERIGDVFLVPPCADLVARTDEAGDHTSIVCHLEADAILSLFDDQPVISDQLLVASLDIRDAKIQYLLLRLAEEARSPGFASQTLIEMVLGQLTIEMARLGGQIIKRHATGRLASWQLRLIDERLKEVRPAPTVSELAALCRSSVRQLTRSFRASRECSLGAYIASKQMEHAKHLLASDESVASIARTLGFSSSSSFCFAFRRAAGMTPGQFRALVSTVGAATQGFKLSAIALLAGFPFLETMF
jgi:AraC family transcriptional regulator